MIFSSLLFQLLFSLLFGLLLVATVKGMGTERNDPGTLIPMDEGKPQVNTTESSQSLRGYIIKKLKQRYLPSWLRDDEEEEGKETTSVPFSLSCHASSIQLFHCCSLPSSYHLNI